MSEADDKTGFAEEAKRQFDASVERLDAATLSRLNQGRQAALAELGDRRPAAGWSRWWVSAIGAVTAVILVAVVLRGPDDVEVGADPLTAADMELLLDDANLEMIEELEFYSWLGTEDLEVQGNVG